VLKRLGADAELPKTYATRTPSGTPAPPSRTDIFLGHASVKTTSIYRRLTKVARSKSFYGASAAARPLTTTE